MRVHSIFESISGEGGSFPQGTWCTFIRLQGCNLRCRWCDTKCAQNMVDGVEMSIDEICEGVRCKHVLITGGEPLMQAKSLEVLIKALLEDKDVQVQVETNGSYPPIPRFNGRVSWVMDYKLPSSGMTRYMLSIDTLRRLLRPGNVYLKFVIAGAEDIDHALGVVKKVGFEGVSFGRVIFSPLDASGDVLKGIVDYIKAKDPRVLDLVVFSLQLHKLVGMP